MALSNVPAELEQLLRSCTVRIITPEANGTGFLIGPGLILTCAHVVEDAYYANAPVRIDGSNNSAAIVEFFPKPYPDLAILELVGTDHSCVHLSSDIGIGDQVWAYGYPSDRPAGDSSLFDYEGPSEAPGTLLKLKAARAYFGLSGAPLLNLRTSSICGILKSSRSTDFDLGGYGIPISAALSRLPYVADVQQRYHRSSSLWTRHLPPNPDIFWNDYALALRDYCRWLPYTELPGSDLPELPSVFVELRATASETLQSPNQKLTIDQALKQHRHLYIEGPAGSGKSTSLRQLAASLTVSILGGNLAGPVPVLLPASRLIERRGPLSIVLRSQVAEELAGRLLHSLPDDFVADGERSGVEWLVLVDGLDEITSSTARRDLLRTLEVHARNDTSHVRFVLTARPLSQLRLPADSVFSTYLLLPFDSTQVIEFSTKWFGRVGTPSAERAELFLMRLGRIGYPLTTPLFLTMAALLFERDPTSDLPAGRSELYREFVTTVLLRQEAERRIYDDFVEIWRRRYGQAGASYADAMFGRRRAILQRLAHALQNEMNTSGSSWLRAVLEPFERADEDWLVKQIDVLMERTGLIHWRSLRPDFLHDSFREYLAAEYLISVAPLDSISGREWSSRWNEERWRDVVLFALGLSGDDAEVDQFIRSVAASGPNGLAFAGMAIGDAVRVSEATEQSVISNLTRSSRSLDVDATGGDSELLIALSRLLWREDVRRSLVDAVRAAESEWAALEIASLLLSNNHRAEAALAWEFIGTRPASSGWITEKALSVLEALGEGERVRAVLDSIVGDSGYSWRKRFELVDASSERASVIAEFYMRLIHAITQVLQGAHELAERITRDLEHWDGRRAELGRYVVQSLRTGSMLEAIDAIDSIAEGRVNYVFDWQEAVSHQWAPYLMESEQRSRIRELLAPDVLLRMYQSDRRCVQDVAALLARVDVDGENYACRAATGLSQLIEDAGRQHGYRGRGGFGETA